MTFDPPPIYPITDVSISGLSHVEQVRQLIGGGSALIQLREKNASSAEFYAAALDAVKFARLHGAKIIINDRVDIAMATGAHGVHLGQKDLPPAEARKLLGDKAIIGLSTHNLQQAIDAMRQPVNYIAVGPIFSTSTKPDPDPVVGLEGLREVRAAVGNIPLIAIGGINGDNLTEVLAAGADSAAIISAVLIPADHIAKNFERLNRIVNKDVQHF